MDASVASDFVAANGVLPPRNLWFAGTVAELTVRTDMLGIPSTVSGLNLNARNYTARVGHFHRAAGKIDGLTALWTPPVLRLFSNRYSDHSLCVLVGNSLKIPEPGRQRDVHAERR